MKKIFTLMLAFACALFVGVSCTPDNGDEGGNYSSTVSVTGAPEANLTPEAGELTLNYTITNPSLAAALTVTTEASWVHVGEVGETSVALTYDANTEAPGSPAREAVVVFAYEGAQAVNVTLKQDSQATVFSVTFSEATSNFALASLTSTDQNMDWLAFLVLSSQASQFGSAADYVMAQYEEAKAMGFPYLYMMSSIYMNGGGIGKGDSVDPIMCQMPWNAEPGDKLYLVVLGYNCDADMMDWAYDNSTLVTAPHVFEVEFLPSPVMNVTGGLEQKVSSEAGSLSLDVTVENPMAGYDVYATSDASWLTATCVDGKITLTYEANSAALSREANVTVEYGSKVVWGEGPDDFYIDSPIMPVTVTVSQEANPNAEVVTFDIQVVETHFNCIIVNITPSNKEVDYYVNQITAQADVNWTQQINNNMRYPDAENFHKGDVKKLVIPMSPGNYTWYGYEYYVYAFATNAEKTAPASEASYTKVTVDASDMPELSFEETDGLVWNESNEQYELKVSAAGTYTFKFNVKNPVAGAQVKLNGETISDNYYADLVGNDNKATFNYENNTVSVELNGYPEGWNKSFAPMVTIYFTYSDDSGQYWGISKDIKLTWVKAE